MFGLQTQENGSSTYRQRIASDADDAILDKQIVIDKQIVLEKPME